MTARSRVTAGGRRRIAVNLCGFHVLNIEWLPNITVHECTVETATNLDSESNIFQLNDVPLAYRDTELVKVEVIRFHEIEVAQSKAQEPLLNIGRQVVRHGSDRSSFRSSTHVIFEP
jgi:hypothetical protein